MKKLFMVALVLGAILAPAVSQAPDERFDKNERKQAESGNSKAEWDLGQWYLKDHYHYNAWDKVSDGISHDKPKPVEAAKWLHRAEDHGYADANSELALGSMYAGQKNYGESFYWFRRAADHGNTAALAQVGDCYALGNGVGKDPAVAMDWYLKAAAAGVQFNNPDGQYALGEAYLGQQNYPKAVEWFTMATRGNNLDAMLALAQMYRDGDGVLRNPVVARGWFELRQQYLDAQAQQTAFEKQQAEEQRRENRSAMFQAVMTGINNGLAQANANAASSNGIQNATNQQLNNINAARDRQIAAQQAAQTQTAQSAAVTAGSQQGNGANGSSTGSAFNPEYDCIGGAKNYVPGKGCLTAAR